MTPCPSNRTAELQVLGACLLGGTKSAEIAAGQVTVEDFGELAHREAWRVIGILVESGCPVDPMTLAMAWKKHVSAPAQPPPEILASTESIATPESLKPALQDLKDASRRRAIWEVGQKLVFASGNMERDPETEAATALSVLEVTTAAPAQSVDGRGAVGILTADLEARFERKGAMTGTPTGFDHLDEMTDGLQPQELSIIGARPSQGKTALLLSIAAHCAMRSKVPVLFISLEMSVPALLRRLASMETGIPLALVKKGALTPDHFRGLTVLQSRLAHCPLHIYDGAAGSNVTRLGAAIRFHVRKHGIKLALVDYLQKIRPAAKHEKRTYEVAEVSSALKGMAVTHGIHICSAAQLSREPEKDKGRLPRLADLADCAQIERDADLVGLLHRSKSEDDPDAEKALLYIAKQRDGEVGHVNLRFNGPLCRFENPQPNQTYA